MPKELDPFREHVQPVENKKWKCKFCSNEYSGSATRIRAHFAGIPRYGITGCEKVDHHVRVEALRTFNCKRSELHISAGGTSSEGTGRIVIGASQTVHQSDNTSNPNDTKNSNQPWCAPQQPSCYWSTGTTTASACPQYQVSLSPGDMALDNLDTTQQPDLSNHRLGAAHGNETASSLQQIPVDSPTLSSFDPSELRRLLEQPTHLEPGREQQNARGLSSFPNGLQGDGITTDSPLYSMDWSNHHHSSPEDLLESRDVILNTSVEIQMNGLRNPRVGSSLQIDSSLDVDSVNRLQDCGQPCVAGVVPVYSNSSPTDAVQHPGQLPPSCGKEDGNDIHWCPSRTSMDIGTSIASQHTSDLGLLVADASIGPSSSHALAPSQHQSVPHQSVNLKTAHQNPTVPSSSWKNHLVICHPQALMDMDPCVSSSSQAPNNSPSPSQILPHGVGLIGPSPLPELDMNEGAPMMSHPSTGNNFEENKDLKRKLELLYTKEANVRDELEFAASLSLKKLRMEVANWLEDVEKLRNDRTHAASEDCLPLHQQVDILMYKVEDLMRQGKGLFEVREIKVNKLLEDKMVGKAFQRNTTKILEYLEEDRISRLGIYGMGGVGKTTIMVHIYNRLLEKANYGNVLWITVSQAFSTQRLQDAIEKKLGLNILEGKDVKERPTELSKCLTAIGKCTIILDDVWEHFDLKEVGIPANGVKLVLTTRSIEVCHQMQCQEMIKIEPLSHIEAKRLFFTELTSEVDLNLETKAIVISIVKECAGLPLAIITMARSMRGVTDVFEWKDSLEKLRESDMGQTDMEKVLKKLKFSYNRLGNHEVQQCFLSCALYPEDYLIDKFKLIEFFIDQGLIGQLSTREKQYDRGLTILNKLQNVCLLENHGSKMKMHDLIRDMALYIMRATSIVKARKGLRRIPSEECWTDNLEKVSLMSNGIGEISLNMSPNCPKLSIFLLNENYLDVVIPNSFFKQLWGLKVLNLSECELRELPDSISNLENLRALLLRKCRALYHIPYLGKLRFLRKLDIFECSRVEMLDGLEMLVNLRYLDLYCTSIKRLPKGTLGALPNLQYLKVHEVNGDDIAKLRALETLECHFEDVDGFNRFVRVVIGQSNNSHYYKLKVDQSVSKIFVEVSNDVRFGNCERKVEILQLSHAIVSAGVENPGSGLCFLIPQDVQELTASNADGTTSFSDMGPLKNLKELNIRKWKNLRVLRGGQDEVIDIHDCLPPTPAPPLFPSLRALEIFQCPKLKYLFGHGLKFYLPHLREIKIWECEEMIGITVAVTSPPPHPPPAFPSLVYISLWRCDKMKRVVESGWLPHFPNLRGIEVFHCENMEEIIGDPPPYMPVEEISLESLEVIECNNIIKLLPHELLIHLLNLQTIFVYCCEEIVEIISRAGQGQEGSIMTPLNNTPSSFPSSIFLPKLNSLTLRDLPQLKSICEVPIICDSMEILEVIECPKLNTIPLQLQLCDIEDLPLIEVEGEEKWKTLIWDRPDAQAILQSHLLFNGSTYLLQGRRRYNKLAAKNK